MPLLTLSVIAALTGGIAVALQGPLSALVGREVGPLGSGFILHASGALIGGILVLATGWGALRGWMQVPWYALIGTGATGLIVIAAFSIAVPRIGMTATASLIIASQMLAAVILDHFALLGLPERSISGLRGLGVALLFAGAWLVLQY